jgi:hypothetical protein
MSTTKNAVAMTQAKTQERRIGPHHTSRNVHNMKANGPDAHHINTNRKLAGMTPKKNQSPPRRKSGWVIPRSLILARSIRQT